MLREFSVFLVKHEVKSWEFPLSWDEVRSPRAGPFSASQELTLDVTLAQFPLSARLGGGRPAWRIPCPAGGELRAEMAHDRSGLLLAGETTLELVHRIFVALRHAVPEVALEDLITHVVHDRGSLFRLVIRDAAAAVPFEFNPE